MLLSAPHGDASHRALCALTFPPSVTFIPGRTGERLPVVPAAVCHYGSGPLPPRFLRLLHEAPDRVQRPADLQ